METFERSEGRLRRLLDELEAVPNMNLESLESKPLEDAIRGLQRHPPVVLGRFWADRILEQRVPLEWGSLGLVEQREAELELGSHRSWCSRLSELASVDTWWLEHWDMWLLGQRCKCCLLYTSPSPRDQRGSRMPSSA